MGASSRSLLESFGVHGSPADMDAAIWQHRRSHPESSGTLERIYLARLSRGSGQRPGMNCRLSPIQPGASPEEIGVLRVLSALACSSRTACKRYPGPGHRLSRSTDRGVSDGLSLLSESVQTLIGRNLAEVVSTVRKTGRALGSPNKSSDWWIIACWLASAAGGLASQRVWTHILSFAGRSTILLALQDEAANALARAGVFARPARPPGGGRPDASRASRSSYFGYAYCDGGLWEEADKRAFAALQNPGIDFCMRLGSKEIYSCCFFPDGDHTHCQPLWPHFARYPQLASHQF